MPSKFQPPNEAAVIRLIDDYPLAWVVSRGGGSFAATPLPLLAETDGEGRLVALIGHFARANPQVAALTDHPSALILFMGPQGYVSPQLVGNPQWAPTWNYAVARFHCLVRLRPETNDDALRQLTRKMERDSGAGWTIEQMGERYHSLVGRVVAFRAEIIDRQVSFKLGQDESEADFESIVSSTADARLVEWMRDCRRRPR